MDRRENWNVITTELPYDLTHSRGEQKIIKEQLRVNKLEDFPSLSIEIKIFISSLSKPINIFLAFIRILNGHEK